jgi:DNA-binding CsgD family transcriptional regulator
MRLIERGPELDAIAVALDAARRGEGRLVVVEGPAGIGKTRLLDAACEQAAAAGMVVLRAAGRELEGDAPYGVATELFGPLLEAAGRTEREAALAGQAGLAAALFDPTFEPPPDAHALVRGLYWLLVGLVAPEDGEAGGALVVVDDAQWADRPSVTFLAHLASRLDGAPIALVLADRSGEPAVAADLLTALRRLGPAGKLSLAPLSDEGIAELVGAEMIGAEPAFLTACAGVSAGNPFVARELARVLRAEGVAPTAEAAARVSRLVPETVMHSLLGQLGRLGVDAEALASAVAILGDDTPLRRAARLAGLEPRRGEEAADALAGIGLLADGEPLRFEHPLIATAVRADAPAFARARAHREAADLLAAEAAPVSEVAGHLLLTMPAEDRWVVEILREAAARALAQGDAPAGARLLARALDEPPADTERGGLLLELAEAEALAGDTAAAAHVDEALETLDRDRDRIRALRSLGRIRLLTGDHGIAAEALEEVLGRLDPDAVEEQQVLAEYLTANRFQAPLLPAAERRLAPVVKASRDGEPPADPALLAHAVLSLALDGEAPSTVLELADRAAKIDQAVDLAGHGMPSAILVQALCCVDAVVAAAAVGEAALGRARDGGSFIATSTASFHRAIPRYYRGELADALADLDQAQATRREGWEVATAWPLALQVHVQLERGELEAARESAALATASEDSMDRALLDSARARLALAERDPDAALALAEAAGRHLADQFGIDNPGFVPWRRTAALAAAALGDEARARELAAEQLRLARANGAARPLSLALRTAASTMPEERQGLLAEAVAAARRSESSLELAHALADLGAAVRRAGKRSEAQPPLREALELADRMGASALADSVRVELRAAGARPRRAARSGVDSLTPAERRVAQLAAVGLTNRQIAQELFITMKTVQTHLSSVYRKLDAVSRRELPELLGAAGP